MLENMCEEPSVSWVVALSLVGMKCVILLNRSTTTMIASKPLDGGKLTMKSMDTLSHDLSELAKVIASSLAFC